MGIKGVTLELKPRRRDSGDLLENWSGWFLHWRGFLFISWGGNILSVLSTYLSVSLFCCLHWLHSLVRVIHVKAGSCIELTQAMSVEGAGDPAPPTMTLGSSAAVYVPSVMVSDSYDIYFKLLKLKHTHSCLSPFSRTFQMARGSPSQGLNPSCLVGGL